MTDEQIIKALECCCTLNGVGCRNCPQYDIHSAMCVKNLIRNALDLINRQKAENERLKCEMGKLLPKDCSYAMQMEVSNKLESQIKSEAIKEFAMKLKCGVPQETGVIRCANVDNLVKEMTEE